MADNKDTNPQLYDALIQHLGKEYGVRPELIRAMIVQESGFKPDIQSNKGAMGMMQLMPGTAKELGVDNSKDPVENIRGGVQYISQLLKKYNGNEALALAAYNAGPAAVDKAGGKVPFMETQNYVDSILKNAGSPSAPSTGRGVAPTSVVPNSGGGRGGHPATPESYRPYVTPDKLRLKEQPKDESGKVSTADWARMAGATAARVGGPWVGGLAGGALGSFADPVVGPAGTVGGAFAGRAAGGAAGEWLAEKLTPEQFGGGQTSAKRIGVAGALGAIPGLGGSSLPIAALEGGGIGYLGVAGNRWAEGHSIPDALDPRQMSKTEILTGPVLGAGLGAGTHWVANRGTATPATETSGPNVDTSPKGLRVAADKISKTPAGTPTTAQEVAEHAAISKQLAKDRTGDLAQRVKGPTRAAADAKLPVDEQGNPVVAPPDMEAAHRDALGAVEKEQKANNNAAAADVQINEEGLKAQAKAKADELKKLDAQLQEAQRPGVEAAKAEAKIAKDQGAAIEQNKKVDAAAEKQHGQALEENKKVDAAAEKQQGQAIEENKKFTLKRAEGVARNENAREDYIEGEQNREAANEKAAAKFRRTVEKDAANAETEDAQRDADELARQQAIDQQAKIDKLKEGKVEQEGPVRQSIKGKGPDGESQSQTTSFVDPVEDGEGGGPGAGGSPTPKAGHFFDKRKAMAFADKNGGPSKYDVVEQPDKTYMAVPKEEGTPSILGEVQVKGPTTPPGEPPAAPPEPPAPAPKPRGGKKGPKGGGGSSAPPAASNGSGVPPAGGAAPIVQSAPPISGKLAKFAEQADDPIMAQQVEQMAGGEDNPAPAKAFLDQMSPPPDTSQPVGATQLNGRAAKMNDLSGSDATLDDMMTRMYGEEGYGNPNPEGRGTAPAEAPDDGAIVQNTQPAPAPEVREGGAFPARFYSSERDLLNAPEGYATTQAAEKAGEIPKTDPFYPTDRRGRPQSPARAQGARKAQLNQQYADQVNTENAQDLEALQSLKPEDRALAVRLMKQQAGGEGGTTLSAFGAGQGGSVMQALQNNPMMAARMGLGLAGAGVGAYMSPDDPMSGALMGGAAGAMLPSAGKAFKNIDLGAIGRRLPDIQRFNYLSDPNGLAANTVAAPLGLGATTSLEKMLQGLYGDSEAGAQGVALAKQLPSLPRRAIDKIRGGEAGEALGNSEMNVTESLPYHRATNWFDKMISVPATYITAGHMGLRDAAVDAGISGPEALEVALGNEPGVGSGNQIIRSFGQGLQNAKATRAGEDGLGAKNYIMNMIAPFTRTASNVVAATPTRTPGLGLFMKAINQTPESWSAIGAQQTLGTGIAAGAYALGAEVPQEQAHYIRKWVRNAAGRYGVIAVAAFEAGQAMQQGKDTGQAVSTAAMEALPMPTTEVPKDWLDFGRNLSNGDLTIPRSAVPTFLQSTKQEPDSGPIPYELMTHTRR